jgi:hypothetical protein
MELRKDIGRISFLAFFLLIYISLFLLPQLSRLI